MSKPIAIIVCLDSRLENVGFPAALERLESGVPSLDYLLTRLRQNNVNEIVIVCSESARTRYFAHYALLRNVEVIATGDERNSAAFTKPGVLRLFINGSYFHGGFSISDALSFNINGIRSYYSNDENFFMTVPEANYAPPDVTATGFQYGFSLIAANTERIDVAIDAVYRLTSEVGWLAANQYSTADAQRRTLGLPPVVEEECHARVGMMGNPSDGFNGKTISFLIENFRAQVRVESRTREQGVEIVDPLMFSSLDDLQLQSNLIGYTSGGRLLQATCKVFSQLCFQNNVTVHKLRCFRMTYDTNIPRMVGLSGSSAIIVAAFRALLKFFGLTIADLNIKLNGKLPRRRRLKLCDYVSAELPQHILDIEKVELGISAGLQDRVIQTYGGLVHMDFTKPASDASRYTSLDPALLPPMYLAYDACAGGDSGKVHSTVRDRWAQQDPELVQGMQTLGRYADEARDCLEQGDISKLAELMEQNFAMRRKLYGDAVVGAKNIRMVELAKRHGLSAKFTGSGGALLCIESNGWGWLEPDEEAALVAEYLKEGFNLVRISIPGLGHQVKVQSG